MREAGLPSLGVEDGQVSAHKCPDNMHQSWYTARDLKKGRCCICSHSTNCPTGQCWWTEPAPPFWKAVYNMH